MIYTFYSYKGGVGRTMALANIAELFYQAGLRVLMVDWDLEAPGLERFFSKFEEELLDNKGVIDLLIDYKDRISAQAQFNDNEDFPFETPEKVIIDIYPEEKKKGKLFLLSAGRRSKGNFDQYANAVLTFDWKDFYENWDGELYFDWLRKEFEKLADIVLIDSRTGVTEMGGVCTYQLADVVVMFCAPNQQNIEGTNRMATRLTLSNISALRHERSLDVIIIPARVEDRSEQELLESFRKQFVDLFARFTPQYIDEDREYFWKMRIPHVPYYAFNELVAVRDIGRSEFDDLALSFHTLYELLAKIRLIRLVKKSPKRVTLELTRDVADAYNQLDEHKITNLIKFIEKLKSSDKELSILLIYLRALLFWKSGKCENAAALLRPVILKNHTVKVADINLPVPIEVLDNIRFSRQDWGEAFSTDLFLGRAHELQTMAHWILREYCQMVGVFGLGGIGKTTLVTRLATQLQHDFDFIFWRSLISSVSLKQQLVDLLRFLSNHNDVEESISEPALLNQITQNLRDQRCLIIFDNIETILQSGSLAGRYRQGYELFGKFIQATINKSHKSCVIIISRENTDEFFLTENSPKVRSIFLSGLEQEAAVQLLRDAGITGNTESLKSVVERYECNPFALRLISSTVNSLFAGNIDEFSREKTTFLGGIKELLENQFERLSKTEKDILYWLAIAREPKPVNYLQENMIIDDFNNVDILEALQSLQRRSLIEWGDNEFTLQAIVMEFITDNLLQSIYKELESGVYVILNSHPLIESDAKEYIRNAQKYILLKPVAKMMSNYLTDGASAKKWCRKILSEFQGRSPKEGYIAGNCLNLLALLNFDLSGFDFSHLEIRNADLRNLKFSEINFTLSFFSKVLITYNYASILSLAISPTNHLVAMGSQNGKVYLFQPDYVEMARELQGHKNSVLSVNFSPNGIEVISGGEDQTLRLWDVATGKCLKIFKGHIGNIYSTDFSPDGKLIASCSEDQTLRLWDAVTSQCLQVIRGHEGEVKSVSFSPDGKLIASGSEDQTLRLWDVVTGECLRVMRGHYGEVQSVSFSPDGKMIVSSGTDQTIRLWDVPRGDCFRIIKGNIGEKNAVVVGPDGKTIISGGEDQLIVQWDVDAGRSIKKLIGHNGKIQSVFISPSKKYIISSDNNLVVRYWDLESGECIRTICGTMADDRPYKGMDITNCQGLSEYQKSSLIALGAIEKLPK